MAGRASREAFFARRDDPQDDLAPAAPSSSYRVHLCFGPNCSPRGSRALLPVLEAAIEREGLGDQVEVIAATCRDRCDYGPSMNVYPGPVFYNLLTPEAIDEIVREHLAGGRPVRRWLFRPSPTRPDRGGDLPPRRWRPS